MKEFEIKSSKRKSKSCLPQWKIINPYISSTFVDLEDEFNFLHSSLFPKLNEWCSRRGCSFAPEDSRRTSVHFRTSSDYILKTALEDVVRSKPFFISIIGSCYGQHRQPDGELLSMTSKQIANQTMMDRNIQTALQRGHTWLMNSSYQYCSIMELEITLAAFLESIPHCFFYIKDCYKIMLNNEEVSDEAMLFEPESIYAQDQLNNLKRRIVNKGLPVKYFKTKEELYDLIYHDWTGVISQLCPVMHPSVMDDELSVQIWSDQIFVSRLQEKYHKYKEISDIETMLNCHATTTNSTIAKHRLLDKVTNEGRDVEYNIQHQSGDGLFSSSSSFVQSLRSPDAGPQSEPRILTLVGDPGSGKTTLLANWLHRFQKENPNTLVLSTFIGSSNLSYDVSAFMRRCIKTLREATWKTKCTSSEMLEDVDTYKGLVETFQSSLSLHPCVVVIDSVNDIKYGMHEDIGQVKGLGWLPVVIPLTCHIIISTRRSDLTYKAIQQRGDVTIVKMPSIDLQTRENILQTYFEDNVVNILGRDHLSKVWANRLSERPLYLATLSHLIMSCRDSHDINQVIEKCTTFRIFRDFWKSVFLLWSRRYSWGKQSSGQPGSIRHRSNASGWVADALKFIATSRTGLLLKEILHILLLVGYKGRTAVSPHDWRMFREAAGSALCTNKDGLITIAHDDVTLALNHCLLDVGCYSSSSIDLLQHQHSLLASYFINHGSMKRKLIELPWHLHQCKDWVLLCQVLCKPRFFISMCEESKFHPSLHNDHKMYWNSLNKHDFNIVHCLKSMVRNQSNSEDTNQATEQTVSKPTLKIPSLIIVTQHDDSPMSHNRSTESRSGTEDRELSETESCSFFLTETDSDVLIGGWSPAEDDPKVTIDSSVLTQNELTSLYHKMGWLLFHMNNRSEGIVMLQKCRQHIDANRPLSSVENLILFESICLQCMHTTDVSIADLQLAINVYDNLSLHTMDLSYLKLRELSETKGYICLHLAIRLMINKREEEAHGVFMVAYNIMKECGSISGHAQANAVFGNILSTQGMMDQAEVLLKKSLQTYLYWHGSKHLKVANLLRDLGELYSSKNMGVPQRKAMTTYRQALDIMQHIGRNTETPQLLSKIGKLLFDEGTLRSKEEALSCFEQSFDAMVTENNPSEKILRKSSRNIKQVLNDLRSGHFAFGCAATPDQRSTERPFSAMSWHNNELDKKLQSSTTSTYDRSSRCSMRGSITSTRPYSSYSARSFANHVVLTPKITPRQIRSSGVDGQCTIPFRSLHRTGKTNVSTYQVISSGGVEPVVIVPGRRYGGNGRQMNVDMKIKSPRTYTGQTRKLDQNCHQTFGFDKLCLNVHGSHCLISDLLSPHLSSRSNKPLNDQHKSAWFNVPGRYKIPGKVIPSKRNQKRTDAKTLSTTRSTSYM
nr:tetratricopeptide repeat protein 41 isoform X1 [Ciona intestinalis]|eukprot:XP_009858535.2 tetratricopeptide repeat protein 41 isoform X1 [Ciona intestinalis]